MSNIPVYYEAADMYGDDTVECCICGKEQEFRDTFDVCTLEGSILYAAIASACPVHFKDIPPFSHVPWHTLPLPVLLEGL